VIAWSLFAPALLLDRDDSGMVMVRTRFEPFLIGAAAPPPVAVAGKQTLIYYLMKDTT
jgi:hypothetical protein